MDQQTKVELGMKIRMKSPGLPGTGVVTHIIPPGQEITEEQMMLFYKMKPGASSYPEMSRSRKVERVVVKRDDGRGYAVYPRPVMHMNAEIIT